MMEADQSMKTVGLPLHAAVHSLHPYPLLTRCGGEGGSWKNRVDCVVLQVKVTLQKPEGRGFPVGVDPFEERSLDVRTFEPLHNRTCSEW